MTPGKQRRGALHSFTIPCANVRPGFRPDHIRVTQADASSDVWITMKGYCRDLGRGTWIALPFDLEGVVRLWNALQEVVETYQEPGARGP